MESSRPSLTATALKYSHACRGAARRRPPAGALCGRSVDIQAKRVCSSRTTTPGVGVNLGSV
eukprot:6564632-Prymnesium_polylepis.1